MSDTDKAWREWRRSFFTRAIAFRYLLTPIGTIVREYKIPWVATLTYLDIYVFGIRVARIHRV